MRISRHQFYTIANRKVHEQKIKEKKTAINLLISDFWSSDIIQRPPLLKGKEENFCHYHSLKNREKKERGRIWDGERRRPRAAALPPSPPPPLPLYWYMLGSTAAPQEKNRTFATTWMHSAWYWSKLSSYSTRMQAFNFIFLKHVNWDIAYGKNLTLLSSVKF